MGKRQPLRKTKPVLIKEKTSNQPSRDDEEAYWEAMEKKSNNKRSRKPLRKKQEANDSDSSDISSSDSEGESEGDEDGIGLDNSKVEHISEEYTFEFNDMREGFTESITTLLKARFIPNPKAAYQVACDITSQTAVGTVIVCEGGDDVFAFATVLPLINQKNGALYNTLQQFAKALDKPTFSTTSLILIKSASGAFIIPPPNA